MILQQNDHENIFETCIYNVLYEHIIYYGYIVLYYRVSMINSILLYIILVNVTLSLLNTLYDSH